MAPSTPPPPRRDELAAFTTASVVSRVRSAGPWNSMVFPPSSTIRILKSGTTVSKPLTSCPSALRLPAVSCLQGIPATPHRQSRYASSCPQLRPHAPPRPYLRRPQSKSPPRFPPRLRQP